MRYNLENMRGESVEVFDIVRIKSLLGDFRIIIHHTSEVQGSRDLSYNKDYIVSIFCYYSYNISMQLNTY